MGKCAPNLHPVSNCLKLVFGTMRCSIMYQSYVRISVRVNRFDDDSLHLSESHSMKTLNYEYLGEDMLSWRL